MSKQNTTEIDAFVNDERSVRKMAKKPATKTNDEYACVGGSPKVRREMKRHMDMMKKEKKEKGYSKEDKD